MASLRRLSSSGKEPCAVCHDDVDIHAIGQCDHHICFKCSTRMRVLCEQMYCAICRADMPKVLFVKEVKKFENIKTQSFQCFRKQQIYFESDTVQNAFYELISHKCKFCPSMKPLRSFHLLEQHMRREHGLHYCDICINLKVFSLERKCYDRERLARHRRLGDEDDKSFKGHPLCELCDQRFLDRDELARHCRKEHYHCHFCETDGRHMEFFGDYHLLRDHFQDEHYLCEDGDCINVQFTNAFRSDIDLKAHLSQHHTKGMKKAEARQARTIELDIQLAPRPSARGGRGRYRGHDRGLERDRDKGDHSQSGNTEENRRQDNHDRKRNYARQQREEIEVAHAVAASLQNIQRQSGSVAVMDPEMINHVSMEKTVQAQKQQDRPQSRSKFEKRTGDFPTLDGKSERRESDEDSDGGRLRDSKKDSLAKKVARANNFSVQDGEMEAEDFPSLAGKSKNPSSSRSNAAWNVTPEDKDFPSLSSQSKNCNIKTNVSRSTGSAKAVSSWAQSATKSASPQTVRSNKQPAPAPTWSDQAVKQSTKTEPSKKPTQPASVPSWMQAPQRPSTAGAGFSKKPKPQQSSSNAAASIEDFPSLSSIGNSLIPSTGQPPAPKLSVFRSSTSASSAASSASAKVVASEPSACVESAPRKPSPANFSKSDFPTLGLGSNPKTTAPKGKWGTTLAEEEPPPRDKRQKRKDAKQDTSNVKQDKVALNKKKAQSTPEQPKEKQPEKKSLEWEPPIAKKTVRVAVEEKQGKEIENFVVQHTKNKKKRKNAKGKTSPANAASTSVNASDRDSDSEEISRTDVKAPNVDASGNNKKPGEKQRTHEAPKAVKSDTQTLQSKPENFPSLSELSETIPTHTVPTMSFSNNDFPSLGSGGANRNPPPGFSQSKEVSKPVSRPPPGFSKAAQTPAGSKPPPGFESSQVDNRENVAPLLNGNGCHITTFSYIPLDGAPERNQRLARDIQQMLSAEQFSKFKKFSGEFRQDEMDGAEYYNRCCDIMDSDSFNKIFSELIVLLPDINKQQVLLAAHEGAKNRKSLKTQNQKKGWKTNSTSITSCPTCLQVVGGADLVSHSAVHNLDSNYPALGCITPSNGYPSGWAKN